MTPLGIATGLSLVGGGWWAWERTRRVTGPVTPGIRREVSLPHEREFELHHNSLSLCSMKVRVCLAELAIPYAGHHVELIETGAYENIRPPFLAVNPAGTVPVLVHRGHPVYESHEQIRHAAAHAPPGSPSLLPEDARSREEMEQWIDRSSIRGDPIRRLADSAAHAVPGLTFPLFAAMIDRIPTRRILEGLLFHVDRRRPLLFLALKAAGLRRMPRLRPLMEIVAASGRHMHLHLDALEARLRESGGPWLLGRPFTLADVSWLVIFERLVQVDALSLFVSPDRRPASAEYWARLRERPSHAQAIGAHAHPAVIRGTTRLRRAKEESPALRCALEGASGPDAGGIPAHGRCSTLTPRA